MFVCLCICVCVFFCRDALQVKLNKSLARLKEENQLRHSLEEKVLVFSSPFLSPSILLLRPSSFNSFVELRGFDRPAKQDTSAHKLTLDAMN